MTQRAWTLDELHTQLLVRASSTPACGMVFGIQPARYDRVQQAWLSCAELVAAMSEGATSDALDRLELALRQNALLSMTETGRVYEIVRQEVRVLARRYREREREANTAANTP